jgi:hypothetical protein
VCGKRKGPFASLRFPDDGTSKLGHGTGPLDAARRCYQLSTRVGGAEQEMGRTRSGLVGGKQGLVGGQGGGARGVWFCRGGRLTRATHHAKSGKAGGAGCRAEQTKVASSPAVVVEDGLDPAKSRLKSVSNVDHMSV